MKAPGVSYFNVAGCDRDFFRCDALASTLSVDACMANRRRALAAPPDGRGPRWRCVGCAVGEAHSGRSVVENTAMYGASICPRCRRGTSRMVGNRWCPSCYNRDREWATTGLGGKGTAITFSFAARRLTAVTEAGPVALREPSTKDMVEIVLQALRVIPGRLAFCRPIGRPAMTAKEVGAILTDVIDLERKRPKARAPGRGGWRGTGRRAAS